MDNLECIQLDHEAEMLAIGIEDHNGKVSELADIAERLLELQLNVVENSQPTPTVESFSQVIFDNELRLLGVESIEVSVESIGDKLRELWKAISAGIRKSMEMVARWYNSVLNGIEAFRKKALELARTAGTFNGHDKASTKVNLDSEHRYLFLSSTEKHPGPMAAMKSIGEVYEDILKDEFSTTLKSAKSILGRLELTTSDTSAPMDSQTIERVVSEVKGDLDESGILTNMNNPKFKTKVWKLKDRTMTTNTKTRYLHDDKPMAGGKALAISGPSYTSFNPDPTTENNAPTSSYLRATLKGARERTGIRSGLVDLSRSVSMPKHYGGPIEMEALEVSTVKSICAYIIKILDNLYSYKSNFNDTEIIKEKLMRKGEAMVSALGKEPSSDWAQVAAYKQSLINYHVARVDNVQNQLLRHLMKVMHSVLSIGEKSLRAYA